MESGAGGRRALTGTVKGALMFEDVVGGAVGGVAAGGAARWVINRRAERFMSLSKAEMAVRLLDGDVPGLLPSWRHGFATLYPGRIEFVSCVGGLTFLRRKPVGVEVVSVDMASRRGLGGTEHFRMGPGCDIVTVRGPVATLEIGVARPYPLEWVLSRLVSR